MKIPYNLTALAELAGLHDHPSSVNENNPWTLLECRFPHITKSISWCNYVDVLVTIRFFYYNTAWRTITITTTSTMSLIEELASQASTTSLFILFGVSFMLWRVCGWINEATRLRRLGGANASIFRAKWPFGESGWHSIWFYYQSSNCPYI